MSEPDYNFRRPVDQLGINPEAPHHVWVKINGHMMSDEAQDQRDEIAEWCLRTNTEEEDMDSVFDSGEEDPPRWRAHSRWMVFGFKDPQKAILFKLSFG